jgi:hypothetical protein
MKQVFKYTLKTISDPQSIEMPSGAVFLSLLVQRGDPNMWFLCDGDTTRPYEVRRFQLFATGEPIPEPVALGYLGAFHALTGSLVLHAFEVLV